MALGDNQIHRHCTQRTFLSSLFFPPFPRAMLSSSWLSSTLFFFLTFNFFKIFIYFWLRWVFIAACGLFSSCGERGLLFVALRRLLIVVASLAVEHRIQACRLQ